jgi:hypothetical protein
VGVRGAYHQAGEEPAACFRPWTCRVRCLWSQRCFPSDVPRSRVFAPPMDDGCLCSICCSNTKSVFCCCVYYLERIYLLVPQISRRWRRVCVCVPRVCRVVCCCSRVPFAFVGSVGVGCWIGVATYMSVCVLWCGVWCVGVSSRSRWR